MKANGQVPVWCFRVLRFVFAGFDCLEDLQIESKFLGWRVIKKLDFRVWGLGFRASGLRFGFKDKGAGLGA